jgi:hypothetical protein
VTRSCAAMPRPEKQTERAAGDKFAAYSRLEDSTARPKTIRDHTAAWERLQPLAAVNGDLGKRVQRFCEAKGITPGALLLLDPRLRVGTCGKIELCFAGRGPTGAVTAIKYRPLAGSSSETRGEAPSTWLAPIVAGSREARYWFVAEGETDACRLLDLAPADSAVLVLPCGAKTFRPEWADSIPRGASVYLCHDADVAGDEGAEKAARLIGGKTLRLRPPVEGTDWCDWPGSHEDFVELVREARGAEPVLEVLTARELCALPDPEHGDELLGPLIVRSARMIVLGHTGAGKSTLISRLLAASVRGDEFLDWQGAGDIRALVVDLEQSQADAKRMLREAGLEQSESIGYALVPDGLALDQDDAQLAAVEEAIVDGAFSVVVFDPYYKAHRAEDANAERQIDDLMRRLDGLRARHGFALVLGAHPRKPPVGLQPALTVHDLAGSGAAVRGAEIIVAIERVSEGYSRLRFLKDRAGRLPVGEAWGLLFDREDGYRRDPNDGKTRDIRAELLAVLAVGEWRTLTELRRKEEDGGIGADPKTIRPVLDALTVEGLLEHRVGPPGRQPSAKCWRVSSARDDTDDTDALFNTSGEPAGAGVVVSSPYREDTMTTPATDTATVGAPGVVNPHDTHPMSEAL